MFKIKKQISKLYMASILGNLSLTGAWVAILAARGYSLIKIGIAETVFHIFSLTFEIPSGVFADVFGRKQMLVVSSIMQHLISMSPSPICLWFCWEILVPVNPHCWQTGL